MRRKTSRSPHKTRSGIAPLVPLIIDHALRGTSPRHSPHPPRPPSPKIFGFKSRHACQQVHTQTTHVHLNEGPGSLEGDHEEETRGTMYWLRPKKGIWGNRDSGQSNLCPVSCFSSFVSIVYPFLFFDFRCRRVHSQRRQGQMIPKGTRVSDRLAHCLA